MTQSMNTTTTIRPAQPSDAPSIAQLGSRVITSSFGYSLSAADLTAFLDEFYTPAAILTDLTNPDKDIVIIHPTANPERVIGFATLTRGTTEPSVDRPAGSTVELQRLYVDSESHGQGLGSKLAGRVEEMARAQGFATLWLGVWEENPRAQRLYGRLGFGRVGAHEFRLGECLQTDWIMVKDL